MSLGHEHLESNSSVTAREVTDEEVAFYEEHGWVKLERFISPGKSAELLAAAQKLKEVAESAPEAAYKQEGPFERVNETADWRATWWAQMFQVWNIRTDPFFAFNRSRSVGRAAHRLMNFGRLTDKEVGVRFAGDALTCKGSMGTASTEVGYHQDYCVGGVMDRVGFFNLWIALDEVTPEQGPMRFFDKSHRAGPLGKVSVLQRYPKFPEHYELSPPIDYKAGDATIHHSLMVHGSLENMTAKPRWSYICSYVPEDMIYKEETDKSNDRPLIYP